ncbi:MAG: DNA translocase FtsK [Desulfobacter sp.]|nr:MAG: DNA translocase FtsK [Desulfobacter sp.]
MKKNSYSLAGNVLAINTESGEFKFKIGEDTGTAKAQRIAELMVGEMEKVEEQFRGVREKSSPYAKLLLANLNISEQYLHLEKEYNRLIQECEQLKSVHRPLAVKVELPEIPDVPEPAEPTEVQEAQERGQAKEEETPPEPEAAPAPEDTEKPAGEPAPESREMPSEPGPLVKQVLETLRQSRPAEGEQRTEAGNQAPASGMATERSTESGTGEEAGERDAARGTDEAAGSERPAGDAMPARVKINSHEGPAAVTRTPAPVGSGAFRLPSLDFLNRPETRMEVDHEAIRRDAELLEQKLGYFGIKGEVMEVSPGPVITTFEYKPAPGIKISKIVNLADDLALALSALSIRLVAPIPGKDVIGIEIPNERMSIVPFADIVGSEAFMNIDSRTPICLGKDIIGNPVVVGLDKMPHLLIAGATGTGKSVALNAMITSILYKSSPEMVKFIMIDPKRIELSLFNDIPHLITPVITDMKKANIALQWVVREMERRYEKLAKLQVRNIEQYNRKIKQGNIGHLGEEFEHFSYIVIIIDELADLMMTASKDIEFSLTRIAQMARAAGIHLILATQRPSVDVLTGIIKANFPTRISFQVSSKTDSRTIIDSNGAETLLGRGDMLFVPPGTARLTRVHGTYLSERELITITDSLKSQGRPDYLLEVITEREEEPVTAEVGEDDYDEKYQAALDFVLSTRQASISSVQRALRVGYNRAARIIDLMEKKGVVGPSDGVKPRQVLVDHRMD